MSGGTVLFSYGSLQLPEVQEATFGRRLVGRSDRLPGFTLSTMAISDPAVVALSGSDRHPAIRATGDPTHEVDGTAFEVTWAELAAADRYEAAEYARTWVGLRSGRPAWVYVDQPSVAGSLGGAPGPDLPEFDQPPADPLGLFRDWLAVAVRRRVREPSAFVLATAAADGRTSGRVVLLKEVDGRGLVFSGDGTGRKGSDLAGNPWATAVFHWRETVQQITVSGPVHATTAAESDAIFVERPVTAQAAAAVSATGRPLASETDLRAAAAARSVPQTRPDGWTGWVLEPAGIEFWHGRPDRLHRRLEYRRDDAAWTSTRLQP